MTLSRFEKALSELKSNDPNRARVRLNDAPLTAGDLRSLARCLRSNPHAKEIDLRNCRLADASAEILSRLLAGRGDRGGDDGDAPSSSVRELDLGYNFLGDGGALSLASRLARDGCRLTMLNLERNRIGPKGASALAEALESNGRLRFLGLGNNPGMGARGAKALGRMLKRNRTISSLDLRGGAMGPEGIDEIAEGLKDNASVRNLFLSRNDVGDRGVFSLGSCLTRNDTLKFLDLRCNKITDKGAMCLSDSLLSNHTISHIQLDRNDGISGHLRWRIEDMLDTNLRIPRMPSLQEDEEECSRKKKEEVFQSSVEKKMKSKTRIDWDNDIYKETVYISHFPD